MKPSRETQPSDQSGELSANPGYVLGQLAKAFTTSKQHTNLAARTRAARKVEKWVQVFKGMLSGALAVGSRTPVADTPAWATLEVVHGGFATGGLLAGGALQPHEEALLSKLPGVTTAPPRAALNSFYLSDDGVAELWQMLVTGCYRVNVPEEGALLVAAWLLAHDHVEQAREVLDAIGPYFSALRFYPIPDLRPLSDSSLVHLQTVRETIQDLQAIQVSKQFQQQREATLVWSPLCDRAVELFLETLKGPVPTLQTGPDGKPLRTTTGKYSIEGGWPCQHYPEGWRARAQVLLKDYRRLRKTHPLCGKPERKGENFTLLRGHLETCVKDPEQLTGKDVGMIRLVLASVATRRGVPGSPRCQRLRQFQAALASRPTRADLARVVIGRLSALPPDDGLDSLDEVLAPVTADEAKKAHLDVGQPLAERLTDKVRRCLAAPVEALVEMNVIPSAEVLAKVVPQITAQVRAAGLVDPDLRRLYTAIYRAFRRRRSLLLLNLQHQVQFAELPWVRAIDAHRQRRPGTQESARQTLEQVGVLAVTAFPQQILPNKLLQEIRALADAAGLQLPLVDEVAADIFMGTFSEKFLRAAQVAAKLLEGTLYERYYGIPYARVRQIDDVTPSRYGGTPTSRAFAGLCTELAGPAGRGSRVAGNGTIIEQEQILTTHNLAVLFDALGLVEKQRSLLPELAQRCFAWICRRQQQRINNWKARLQTVKNAAYAWRQMIFFLALRPDAVPAFLAWASDHLTEQRPEFVARFRPALDGLARAAQGSPSEEQAERGNNPRRFLGWTTETHWLLRE